MVRQIATGKISSITKVNSYIYDIWIDLDSALAFSAGQFISLFINETESRAFSIASSPKVSIEQKKLRLILGPHEEGLTIKMINTLKVGSDVKFRGPFGIFTFDRTIPDVNLIQDSKNLVFIATSTGIAPFLGMMEYLADTSYAGNVSIYFGVRYEKDIAFKADFEELAKKLKFEYYFHISKPEMDFHESERVKKGYVTQGVMEKQNSNDYCFICGSTNTVSGIGETLKQVGYKNIFFENYG